MREADLFVLPEPARDLRLRPDRGDGQRTAVGGDPGRRRAGGAGRHAGELVEPRDPAALAAAIERVLARPFDPEALAREARERYGYDAFAAEWTAVYEALLASRRGRTSSATVRRSDSSP